MTKRLPKTAFLLLFLAISTSAHAGDDMELIQHMGTMQYMAHKAGLAIDSRNQPLASFYMHEIEEVIEKLKTVESYDGYPIASLVQSKLMPSFEKLEQAVTAVDWEDADSQFEKLLASCNTCHQATEHSFIRVRRTTANPFMQSFDPQR
ncbi:MAG: hypothetical protein N838_31010 [Thiohalocapsa sp. PB-PSB1]|jgi:hypothetical protein|nr:MAG: hypothetical protein N838_31010 [Thiohalocapsa sp. PB-PSB1]